MNPEELDYSLLAVDLDEIDTTQLLAAWDLALGGRWLPMLVTALGDAFVQSASDGRVCFLDAAAVALEPVCARAEELEALLEDPEFIDHYFDPAAVAQLIEAGLRREDDQVYVLRQSIRDGGQWTLDNIVVETVEARFGRVG